MSVMLTLKVTCFYAGLFCPVTGVLQASYKLYDDNDITACTVVQAVV